MASSSASSVANTTTSIDGIWAELDELDRQAVGEDLAEHFGPGVEARFTQLVRKHHRRALARQRAYASRAQPPRLEASNLPQADTSSLTKKEVIITKTTIDPPDEQALVVSREVSQRQDVPTKAAQAPTQDAQDDSANGHKNANLLENEKPAPLSIESISLGAEEHDQRANPGDTSKSSDNARESSNVYGSESKPVPDTLK